jgi:hypothetical protein
MFGLRRKVTSYIYTWRDIIDEVIGARARDSEWSLGMIRDAVRSTALKAVGHKATINNCKLIEVLCERCGFPLIGDSPPLQDVIYRVERIGPNGYLVHPASMQCELRSDTYHKPPQVVRSHKAKGS